MTNAEGPAGLTNERVEGGSADSAEMQPLDPRVPPRLVPGDRVRFVSPASTPTKEGVEKGAAVLESFGLRVEYGEHIYDRLGYLAGTDEHRLADLNEALRDPGIKAVVATRGGKGAYRIAEGIDFDAARQNPKLIVGFSEITVLHLAMWKHCQLAGLHGAAWGAEDFGIETAESFHRAALTTEATQLSTDPQESTAPLTTTGTASGILLGGNQDMVATAAGWILPSLEGAILLLEAVGMRLGQIDRQLTMLQNAGHLNGIRGIAIGQYTDCEPDGTTQGSWTAIDVLRDRLHRLDVPILGGLPIGHGPYPRAVPVGTQALLNADEGTLTVAAGVQ